MALLEVPTSPPASLAYLATLDISAWVELSSEDLGSIAATVPESADGDFHTSCRQKLTILGETVEVIGILGLHRVDEPGEDSPVGNAPEQPANSRIAHYLHYSLTLRRRSSTPRNDPKWEKLFEKASGVLPIHSADVRLVLEIPKGEQRPAIALPIELTPGTLGGFSAINGVRLVQADPENGESEIYGVTLQEESDQLIAIVGVEAEVTLGAEILSTAWNRALAVAKLAVPTLEVTTPMQENG